MDLMMDAFKTQGQTSLQSHIGEIKMMEAAPYSTLVKELWEHPEQHKKKKEQRHIGADISGETPD